MKSKLNGILNLHFSLFIFITLSLVGCGDSNKSGSNKKEARSEYKGNLVKLLDQMYDPNGDVNLSRNCDVPFKKKKYQIAQFLDKNRDLIENYAINKTTTDNCDTDYESDIIKILACKFTSDKTDWYESEYHTQSAVFELFDKLDKQKVNASWVNFNSTFRSILSSDEQRILQWKNFSITPKDIPIIQDLNTLVVKCLARRCVDLDLSPEMRQWMQDHSYYDFHYNKVSVAGENAADYENKLSDLQRRIRRDLEDHSPVVIKNLSLNKNNELIVPMFMSETSENHIAAQKQFKKYFDDVWSDETLKVKTVWLKKDFFRPLGFEFIFSEIGETAFVLMVSQKMHVPRLTRTFTLSHEFGHVLGLNDNYFEVFKFDKCQYSNWFKASDIMSRSATGRVLPEHRAEILKLYSE